MKNKFASKEVEKDAVHKAYMSESGVWGWGYQETGSVVQWKWDLEVWTLAVEEPKKSSH